MDHMIEFIEGYLECALWAGLDYWKEGEEPRPLDENYGMDDIADKAMKQIRSDCYNFVADNYDDLYSLAGSWSQHGHDFLLTRDGHGTGFWDRGYGEVGRDLTTAARVYGDSNFYVGDDGKVYV